MKNLFIFSTVIATLMPNPARAEEQQSDNLFSANAAFSSDYRYRGISQTRRQAAFSGGADYVHTPTGIYAGVWASTITWTKDAGGDGSVEIDLYAGKRGKMSDSLTYDVGALRYAYPSNGLQNVAGLANANTTELYAQLGYGPAYIKYAHAVTNVFGFVDSKGSGYLDLGANVDLDKATILNLHLGHQSIRHTSAASYTDWKVGITRDLGFASATLAVVGTDASQSAYRSPKNGKFLGNNSVLLSMSKNF